MFLILKFIIVILFVLLERKSVRALETEESSTKPTTTTTTLTTQPTTSTETTKWTTKVKGTTNTIENVTKGMVWPITSVTEAYTSEKPIMIPTKIKQPTSTILKKTMESIMPKSSGAADENEEEDSMEDVEIASHVYREPGCPHVAERYKFNSDMFDGEWKIPYGSMNWLADLATSFYKRRPKVKEIKDMCLIVNIKSLIATLTSNATFEVDWKCSKSKRQMANKCWPQRPTYITYSSKFECYFPEGDFHAYIMVGATDSKSWIILIRCRIGEGMSWIILSKNEKLHSDTINIIFGILEGYGFDLPSFKFEYSYNHCN